MPTKMAFGLKRNFLSDDPMEKLGVGGRETHVCGKLLGFRIRWVRYMLCVYGTGVQNKPQPQLTTNNGDHDYVLDILILGVLGDFCWRWPGLPRTFRLPQIQVP